MCVLSLAGWRRKVLRQRATSGVRILEIALRILADRAFCSPSESSVLVGAPTLM